MRQIVIETDLIPIEDIKTHIKAEAAALPRLLRHVDDPQALREGLLRLQMQTDRVMQIMQCGRRPELQPLPRDELSRRLAKAAGRLPTELTEGNERRRAKKLHEISVLCQRLLMFLMLSLLVGVCPLCQISYVLCDHEKSSLVEFRIAP
jgi:hypothetical protein